MRSQRDGSEKQIPDERSRKRARSRWHCTASHTLCKFRARTPRTAACAKWIFSSAITANTRFMRRRA
eukprot:7930774-Pyramimonas_sp.AAC.1